MTWNILTLPLDIVLVVWISLVIVGFPAALLKTVAAVLGAPNRNGLALRSILWGALVGIVAIVLQMTANYSAQRIPNWRDTITALGGWQWTAIGFAVLTVLAVVADYWLVVRPSRPRLSVIGTIWFLAFSNIWVLEGGWLLASFNQMTLFPTCYDPTAKRIVNTFSEPRPTDCEEISD